MSQIWEILHKPETVVFFDIDGTLTSYNYGEHHAHHELDYTPEFKLEESQIAWPHQTKRFDEVFFLRRMSDED